MSANENEFLFTPDELTIPPEVCLDGAQHGGVTVVIKSNLVFVGGIGSNVFGRVPVLLVL